jgi:hypothetical protein
MNERFTHVGVSFVTVIRVDDVAPNFRSVINYLFVCRATT